MNDMRSLVLVTTSFPILGDGSEAAGSFVGDLVEELGRYLPVRVVAPGRQAGREDWAPGVEVLRFPSPPRPLSTLKPWRLTDLFWIARILRGGFETTRAAVAEGGLHVVALWGLPSGEWARRAARAAEIDYTVWLLGSDVWTLGRVPVLRNLLGRVIRQAHHAYADGYGLAEEARFIAGAPVKFLPSTRRTNLVATPSPHSDPPYRFLFLGRWHSNKGIDLLLHALALLKDEDWRRIECVEINGGGPLENLVRERVGALRALGRPVKMGGFLGKADAEAAIVRSDWVLIPSRIESIPVVFSDALKLGRPVVSTPVGDLKQLIETHRCGVLCETADAPGIASAIQYAAHISTSSFLDGVKSAAGLFSIDSIAQHLLTGCLRRAE